ncbi:MAG TPA: tetratricopeptide repeat protein [Tepidisphaeraceae bacterium]|nr:tetratricopeptide repeat protein [Tepidisphaeraceae bacterium]
MAQEELEAATQLHLAGKIDEAEWAYARLISAEPQNAEAFHRAGILAYQRGQFAQAVHLAGKAIAIDSTAARYHCAMGNSLASLGKMPDAAAAYQEALRRQEAFPEALTGLGGVLQAMGKFSQAVEVHQKLVSVAPKSARGWTALGISLQSLGRIQEAIAAYQKVLSIEPNHLEAMSNLGAALQGMGSTSQALALFRKALEVNPAHASSMNNLGNALAMQGKLDEARMWLAKAVQIQPQFALGWYNLGNVELKAHRFAEAAQAYRRAIELSPRHVDARINLGNALQGLGKPEESATIYLEALNINGNSYEAANNLANVLRNLGRMDESVAALEHCLKLRPNFPSAYCNLGNVLKDTGRLDEAIAAYQRAVETGPAVASSYSNLIFTLYYHPAFDGPRILAEHRKWNQLHALPLRDQIRPHENNRAAERRLRVGYVAPHFRGHCQSLFTIPLLSHHDHERFEIFCYASVARPDDTTRRLMSYSDTWREVASMNDAELAELIRRDQIDILVDLTMHMAHGRPLLMARKPAPVQVAWLAYPGTTGLDAIDYRLTDPHLDPPEFDSHYCEKSIRLPRTFWCYDPLSDLGLNELPAIANGYVTFGCLNNFCKVTAPTLKLWRAVFERLPRARFVLLCPPGSHRGKIMEALDLDESRLRFVPFQGRDDYLREYHRIDIGLDTIPYNGHTTSLDSFWMGVPVISRIGQTAVGRAGLSQLSNLDLKDLAADSDEKFVEIACSLATNLDRLSELRRDLRERMRSSALMDGRLFATDIEAAYRGMWK